MAAGITLNRSRQVPAEDTPAFGGIAERFRRAGDLDRAIQLCRDGLKKFPDHLSARVTLGWSLLDLGKYDDARVQLEQALKRAPDNLAAIRGLAELHERAEQTMNLPMDGPGQWPPDAETIDALTSAPADDLDLDFSLEVPAAAPPELRRWTPDVEAKPAATSPDAAPAPEPPAKPRPSEVAGSAPPSRRKVKAGKRASSRAGRAKGASPAEPLVAAAVRTIEPAVSESAPVLTNSAGVPIAPPASANTERIAENAAPLVPHVELETFASAVAALAAAATPELASEVVAAHAPVPDLVEQPADPHLSMPVEIEARRLDIADAAILSEGADDVADFELSADVSLDAAMQDLVRTDPDTAELPVVLNDLGAADVNLDQLVQQLAVANDDDDVVVAARSADLMVFDEAVPKPATALPVAEVQLVVAVETPPDDLALILDQNEASSELDLASFALELGGPAEAALTLDVVSPVAELPLVEAVDALWVVDEAAAPVVEDPESSELDVASFALDLGAPAQADPSLAWDVASLVPEVYGFAPILTAEVAEFTAASLAAPISDLTVLDKAVLEPATLPVAELPLVEPSDVLWVVDEPVVQALADSPVGDVLLLADIGTPTDDLAFIVDPGPASSEWDLALTVEGPELAAALLAEAEAVVAELVEEDADPNRPVLVLTNPTIEDFPDLAAEMSVLEAESTGLVSGDLPADDLPLLSAFVSETIEVEVEAMAAADVDVPSGPVLELTNPTADDFPEPIDLEDTSEAALVDGFDAGLPDFPILTYLASLPDEPEPVVIAARIPSARIPLGRFLRQVQARRRQLVSESVS